MLQIVVSFDRLPAFSLGCYGQLQCPTPNFDLLATRGELYESCYAATVDIGNELPFLNSLAPDLLLTDVETKWSGKHAICPDLLTRNGEELAMWLNTVGLPASGVVVLHSSQHVVAGEAIEAVLQAWGLELELPTSALSSLEDLMTELLRLQTNPFTVNRILQCVLTLHRDRYLGELLPALEAVAPDSVIALTASGGDRDLCQPTHSDWMASVSEPVAHVPLIVVGEGLLPTRVQSVITTSDIQPLLRNIVEDTDDNTATVDIHYESRLATVRRTHEWMFVQSKTTNQHRLFRKPEDTWESLDVATQYPDVLQEFLSR